MVQQRAGMLWTVNRIFALVVGVIFVILSIIGFLTPTENATGVQAIFGIFDVDTIHNIIYLVTGLIAIATVFIGHSRTFNQVFGVVYTLLGLAGLIPALYFPAGSYGHDTGLFLGLTHINAGDHILHLIVGIAAIVVGFFMAGSASHVTPAASREGDTV
ncbi:MAG: DUF4383 domain-containing protein [Ktedonobacteraceae bacterium]|nr:DUF4383 domain-containing protein [Ktedonobacteraceae bacterium]